MKKLVIYFTIICLTYSLETATFILDNDMLFSDKWYTNGMEVKYDDYFFNKEKNNLKYNEKDTYLIGQKMFVPTTFYKSSEYIDTYDRPFAGYLYFGKLKEKYFENNNYTKKGLLVEIIGSKSFAEDAQEYHHENFGMTTPRGWDTQIEDIYGLAYIYERSTNYKEYKIDDNISFDERLVTGLHMGNVMFYGELYGAFRFGKINKPYEFKGREEEGGFFSPDELYMIAEGGVMAKVHDSTLEGDWFGDNSPLTVDYYPLLATNKIGFVSRWNNFQFDYELAIQSTEIKSRKWSMNDFKYHTLKFTYIW